MKRNFLALATAAVILLIVGCSDDDSGSPTDPGGGGSHPDTASYATDIKPILASRCATSNCHGSGSIQGGLVMGDASYATVSNASGQNGPVIVPGSSATSNLYLKVTSSPPFGARMPQNGSALSVTQQDLIKLWIDQGAMDN